MCSVSCMAIFIFSIYIYLSISKFVKGNLKFYLFSYKKTQSYIMNMELCFGCLFINQINFSFLDFNIVSIKINTVNVYVIVFLAIDINF